MSQKLVFSIVFTLLGFLCLFITGMAAVDYIAAREALDVNGQGRAVVFIGLFGFSSVFCFWSV